LASAADSRPAPGESRTGHFADAVNRISERLATGSGYSDGTDGNASIDYHDKVGRPTMKYTNGMNDDPDIPRFGADRTYDD
jgi:hypothetical protein